MYLISTSKKTVLSDFADLETKSIFEHTNGESTDFQFNAQRRVFVEVDRKAGLSVMRIKEKHQNTPEIQRVRKLTIENVYSVCCAKTASNQIAIGQSSGFVKQFDFRTAELIHRYPADPSRGSVLFVDYNCTDEYIAAVMESGKINIFGTKTKQKMETLSIDEQSFLARFHPSKRFQLAIASFKGAVTVHDVQLKRSIFHIENAHESPCRDVGMCSSQPSLLVSVGYDCKINIFDIRRNKAQSSTGRLSYSHPLSTVALSECGTYFCAGNLKGELISYDMRSTKAPLALRSVHDGCAVMRVAFVPIPAEEQQSSSFSSSNNVTMESGATVGGEKATHVEQTPSDELRKSIAYNLLSSQQQLSGMGTLAYSTGRSQRDSFCDFLDAHKPRAVDRMSTRLSTTARRDSFDWDALHFKAQCDEQQSKSIAATGSGLSSLDSSTGESLLQTISGPLRDRSNISGEAKLKQIAETDEHSELHEKASNCSENSDKENAPMLEHLEQKQRLRMLSASRNSTPHHATAGVSKATNLQLQPQQLLVKSSSNVSSTAGPSQYDFQAVLTDMRELIDERFDNFERELKWSFEKNKFNIFNQLSAHCNQQFDATQEIRDGMALLLRRDPFMKEYLRVQKENEVLRAQLQHALKVRDSNDTNDA
ncbi:Grip71 [Drosophila busckii]|uniref:Grip71 n=1 Tax=Drosophila busckii TaxID=30019 RepID=A0A0M4EBK6_DROBS|nr:uncharacterized protein LOC108607814 [Drosophila busckii]ALC39988.1 Grip71 [Drosophila busckii]